MDLIQEIRDLLSELKGKYNIEKHQTDRMFALHNQLFTNMPEHGKSCASCRSRVYNRLKNYINKLDGN